MFFSDIFYMLNLENQSLKHSQQLEQLKHQQDKELNQYLSENRALQLKCKELNEMIKSLRKKQRTLQTSIHEGQSHLLLIIQQVQQTESEIHKEMGQNQENQSQLKILSQEKDRLISEIEIANKITSELSERIEENQGKQEYLFLRLIYGSCNLVHILFLIQSIL